MSGIELLNRWEMRRLSRYITRMLRKGISRDDVISQLEAVGWPHEMAEDAVTTALRPKESLFEKTELEEKGINVVESNNIDEQFDDLFNKSIMQVQTDQLRMIMEKGGVEMPKRMAPEDALHFLRNVESDRVFYCNNGEIIHNIEELSAIISAAPDDVYAHHVTSDRNDFSNWVNDVVGDKTLAGHIMKAKGKATFLKRVSDRLSYLRGVIGK